jgi:hypothetical protein
MSGFSLEGIIPGCFRVSVLTLDPVESRTPSQDVRYDQESQETPRDGMSSKPGHHSRGVVQLV